MQVLVRSREDQAWWLIAASPAEGQGVISAAHSSRRAAARDSSQFSQWLEASVLDNDSPFHALGSALGPDNWIKYFLGTEEPLLSFAICFSQEVVKQIAYEPRSYWANRTTIAYAGCRLLGPDEKVWGVERDYPVQECGWPVIINNIKALTDF